MHSPLQSLRNRFIRSALVSQLFSQIAIWVRNFAVLLFIMEKTGGDAFAVSMISVAEYAPIFLFSFIGGVFADRWRPKRTVVACDLLSALSVAVVLVALKSGAWEAAFAATLCSAVASQFAQPAGMKLFKMHVADDEAQSAMSILQTTVAVFTVLGPVAGTFVYRQWGIDVAIALTGLLFVLSAAAMTAIPPDRAADVDPEAQGRSLLQDMRDGIRYVARHRKLLPLSLCFATVGLGVGLIAPLGVFVVTERLGLPPEALPWTTIPYGLGELIGGAATFALAAKVSPLTMLAAGLLANAAGIAVSGLSGTLWLTMAAQFALALFQPAIFVGNNALVMKHADEAYVGRVTGIRTPLMTGAMVVMMSVSGVLKESLTLVGTYALAGSCFAAGFVLLLPLFGDKPARKR
ncbi:MFS transporter [Paenibacillus sp. GYB003]|uniref:MFS transporter n=1 Tax=Paenibacillus sp. GYB003 TaxID=2994392 RepID=UPI002F964E31